MLMQDQQDQHLIKSPTIDNCYERLWPLQIIINLTEVAL